MLNGPVRVIALVGMPGCGKSTVGRHLARQLRWHFVDSDHVIERRAGGPIADFFALHGELAFRDLEASIVAELIEQSHARDDEPGIGTVLATGGGAVLRETTRRLLHDRSAVVYLRSTPDDLGRRLRHDDRRRPLLQVADPLARLRELFDVRDPVYREAAHLVVETGRQSVVAMARVLRDRLDDAGATRAEAEAAEGASVGGAAAPSAAGETVPSAGVPPAPCAGMPLLPSV